MIELVMSLAHKSLKDPDRNFELSIPAFSVRGGERVAIVGTTGSGKTTAMDMLAMTSEADACQTYSLTAGAVVFDLLAAARNARKRAQIRARYFGYVMQRSPLFPFLTVLENITLQQRISAVRSESFILDLMERLGIATIANAYPFQISEGQKQRTAIARSLSHKPSIILCDEPTGALDPITARSCIEAIDWAAEQSGGAVIMITHDWDLARSAGFDFCKLESHQRDDQACGQSTAGTQNPSVKDARMIAFSLATRSLLRNPRPNLAAMIALVSVLVPTLLLWSMKVGFIQSLMDDMRRSPASLEVRVKGDYVITPESLEQVRSLPGVGFVLPTARYLATRAYASVNNGRNRTPVSLLPTAPGDPLLRDFPAMQADEAVISSELADTLELDANRAIEIANQRRPSGENLRIPLKVVKAISGEGISGNWIFVRPEIITAVEAFLDGFAVPSFGASGKPISERPDVYSGLRLYASDIDHVTALTAAMKDLGYTVESNAHRIETIRKLDAILSRIVAALALVLLIGLLLSVWSQMTIQLDRLRQHVALLGLMGQGRFGVGAYFLFIGVFNAIGGLLLADLLAVATMYLGNGQFRQFITRQADIFVLPPEHLLALNGGVLLCQILLASFIAFKASHIQPGVLFRDY